MIRLAAVAASTVGGLLLVLLLTLTTTVGGYPSIVQDINHRDTVPMEMLEPIQWVAKEAKRSQ